MSTTNFLLAPMSRMSRAKILLPLGLSRPVIGRTLLVGNLQPHWILYHTIFKESFFNSNYDVILFCLALLLKHQQFVSATVVRECLVALRYVILHFGYLTFW
jgi:hypothetical protein